MTKFDTEFAAASPVLLEEFGEWIGYRSRDGTARTIRAIIHRFTQQKVPETGQIIEAHIEVEVSPNISLKSPDGKELYGGIGTREFNRGGDVFEIEPETGRPRQDYALRQRKSDTDSGMLLFEC